MEPAAENLKTGSAMLRESGKLSLLTMVSRILGLLRETTRARLLGTGSFGEAFSVAFSAPNLFRKLLAEGAMSVAFIPTMKTYFTEADDKKTRDFLSATFSVLTVCVLLVVAAGMSGAVFLTRAYSGVGLKQVLDVGETAILMRMMFPFLALVALAAFFQGILNAHGIFSPSAYGPILFNLCFLVVPVFISRFFPNPARAMAVGVLVGGFAQAVCQLPFVLRLGKRFGFVAPWIALRNPGMKRILLLLAPTIVGTAAYELNAFISTGLASGVGAATSLQYSLRLQELILGVFVVSISTVLLPELSGLAVLEDWVLFVDRFRKSLESIILVTVPIMVFSILERFDIVALLFQSGKFTAESVKITASAFLFHSLGLVFIAANRIITPVFYSRKDSRNPTWAGLVAVGVNTLCAWLFSLFMGGSGIAFALTLASIVNCGILVLMMLRMKLPGMGHALLSSLGYACKLLVFSAIAGLPLLLLRSPLQSWLGSHSSRFVFAGVPLVISTLIYGTLGVGLLILTRDPIARFLVSSFRRRGKNRSA